ncbi:hypothetical protein P154DRAFT_519780 [Amniculicola lignicola CBS 123094]|uniref:Uncharacterized protein n=1 Tax=Amniculicola lignicola CBS 123094 TaxID=1392246 RepID=A0A6A5WPR8_9PLEO|nr:hypothetical protein P154DRAFT_519780 [Amniculicola lignicola CBS 123094]
MGTPQQNGLMPEAERADGVIVLHEMPGCLVTKYPDSTVVKRGRRVTLYEARALALAAQLKLPVYVYMKRKRRIRMEKVLFEWISSIVRRLTWFGTT